MSESRCFAIEKEEARGLGWPGSMKSQSNHGFLSSKNLRTALSIFFLLTLSLTTGIMISYFIVNFRNGLLHIVASALLDSFFQRCSWIESVLHSHSQVNMIRIPNSRPKAGLEAAKHPKASALGSRQGCEASWNSPWSYVETMSGPKLENLSFSTSQSVTWDGEKAKTLDSFSILLLIFLFLSGSCVQFIMNK